VIKGLKLRDFRNYESMAAEFGPGRNAIIGDNGRGKTNLLEAVFFLLQGRSMRTSDVRDMIRNGQREAILEGTLHKDRDIVIRVIVDREGGVKEKGGLGDIKAVSFQPDDIWMTKGGPESRRRCLDEVTLEIKRGYREILREYQRVLRQRNEAIRAVRKGLKERDAIRNWNPLLLNYGRAIMSERTEVLRGIKEEMAALGERWGKGEIEIKYYSSMGDISAGEDKAMERIKRMEEAEIRRGVTLAGPHRDELVLFMAGRNVRRECSQGEQKLVTVMWRLAQASLLEKGSGARTVLLMDDCLSELDEGNRALLVDELGNWEQAIITTTDDLPELAGDSRICL
jgi:DNA replication and repair protein RecF